MRLEMKGEKYRLVPDTPGEVYQLEELVEKELAKRRRRENDREYEYEIEFAKD